MRDHQKILSPRGGFCGNAFFEVLEVLFPSIKTASECVIITKKLSSPR